MPDRNTQEITKIVLEFYKLATTDMLIGYQFRKIQKLKSADPLTPPIEAFKDHLPRIEKFWRMILLREKLLTESPFDLIELHRKLNINPGELDRWIKLFKGVLANNICSDNEDLYKEWEEKINDFEKRFKRFLFN
ncbi:hypothetical protein [Halobacteriovorax sp. HLS]|uniref:hypothetical protein n=1 Tax=Halobacteriovorax sp. HLS TaxID=2234000 RepID=UPI000FD90B5F|nr:hypothetical protein [Halobacteriovorax sp. HLS]